MNILVQDTTENLQNHTALTFASSASNPNFSEHLQELLRVYKFEGKTGQVVSAPSFGFANASAVLVAGAANTDKDTQKQTETLRHTPTQIHTQSRHTNMSVHMYQARNRCFPWCEQTSSMLL